MNKAKDIIDYIVETYNLNNDGKLTKDAKNLYSNEAKIEIAFSDFELPNILNAINEFWKSKNNDKRPAIKQILNILNKKNKNESDEAIKFKKPTCPMFKYQTAYEEFILLAHQNGFICSRYYENQGVVFDITKEIYLKDDNVRKKSWDWRKATARAKEQRPDIFKEVNDFGWANGQRTYTEMAIAHSLGYF